MGLRRALAAPLQASPFILASLYAIIRALLKERPWSTQARAQKELTDSIPRVSPGTRVCVYGLSANPPTGEGGHATIVAHLRRMFDEVWVLPVYRHAFESKSNLAPYDHRVRMCELAFGLGNMTEQQRRTEKVKVLDVERAVVRAAWDRHRVAEEEAKRVRADAHARRRGGGGDASSSRASDGSAPIGIDSLESSASAAIAEGPRDPADEPVRVHRERARIPVQNPDDDRWRTERRWYDRHDDRRGSSGIPPPKVGSFDVITAIREANPFASFSWCLGADTFADLRRGKGRTARSSPRCARSCTWSRGWAERAPRGRRSRRGRRRTGTTGTTGDRRGRGGEALLSGMSGRGRVPRGVPRGVPMV